MKPWLGALLVLSGILAVPDRAAAACTPWRATETAYVTGLWTTARDAPVRGELASPSGRLRIHTAAGIALLPFPRPVRVDPGVEYCLDLRASGANGAAAPLLAPGAPVDHGPLRPVVTPARRCTRFAATTGDDGAPGTAVAPYETVERLVEALGPGQTGCLVEGGEFRADVAVTEDGVTLKTSPGSTAPALVRGRIQFDDSADGGWVDHLRYDTYNRDFVPGEDFGGLKVYGDRFRLTNSEVFSSRPAVSGICTGFGFEFEGDPAVGPAKDVLIARNRFHDCGHHIETKDHAIYLDIVDGGLVEDNVFHDNLGGWGVHFFPDAQDVVVRHNTFDGPGGGIMVAGDEQDASSGNRIEANVITDPGVRPQPPLDPYRYHGIETSWAGPEGSNVAVDNCIFSPEGREVVDRGTKLEVSGTITDDPPPCRGLGAREP